MGLRRLHATATEQERPVVVSFETSKKRWQKLRFDRWFDVELRIRRSDINVVRDPFTVESVEIQITRNRHGTTGTVYLEHIPSVGRIYDIDAQPVAMTDLHRSLEKINARHGETLRRLGEGPHESDKEEEST
jgi:hypothetical protein